MRFAQATPYVVAVAVFLFIVGLKRLLDPLIGPDGAPLLFLCAAVMVSAWFGNWKSGLLTLVLAAVATAFLGPQGEPHWHAQAAIRATLFTIEGGLVLLFAAALHRAREKAERSRRETLATIAQREEADRSLQSSRARFRRLVEANIIGVFFCEEDGRVFEANQSFLALLGYTEEDVRAGRLNVAEITPREFIDVTIAASVELAREGRCQPYEKELIRKDGTRLPVLIGTALLSETEGQTVSFAIDLSEQKATESELQQAKEEAERANRLKSDFLANISHELRTPMNAILGMTQLALDEPLPPNVREYLETAYDSGKSLLSLVNEILDFSKMEAGRFELEMAPFRLRELIDDSFRTLALHAAEKHLVLSADVAWNVPDELIGDAQRLRQVIVNLVGNGIKFTPQGKVALDVTVTSQTSDEIVLHFAVTDTGIGISEEDQERIFAPFTQVDTSTTRRYGGTGLGLAISSELIRMHGGRLELHSKLGEGSRFEFDARFGLPAPGPGDALPAITVEELSGMPVLVIDEVEADRQQLAELLAGWDMRPVHASSGQQGWEMLQAAAAAGKVNGHPVVGDNQASPAEVPANALASQPGTAPGKFALVLIASNLSGTDGFALAERIRRDPVLGDTPIVLLTPAQQPAELHRCELLHIAGCVPKPMDEALLLDAIINALNVPPSKPSPDGQLSASTRTCPPLHVLLAEDTPANCHVVRAILEKRGHQVTVVSDGRQAVEAVQQQGFDLVLMDVQMPEMDGLEAAMAIRAQEHRMGSPPLPIIAMTAHAMKGDRHRCLAAGMNAYLAKPIDAHKLIELIESVGPRPARSAAEDPEPSTGDQGGPDSRRASVEATGQAARPSAMHRPDACRDENEHASAQAAETAAAVAEAGNTCQEQTVTSKAAEPLPDESPLEIPDRVACNLDAALKRLGNNRSLLKDMFLFYKEDAPQLIEDIRQGIARRDREDTARAAHSLKGLSSSFDAEHNVEAAMRIQRLAEAERFDAIVPLLDGLTILTQKLIDQIAAELGD